MKGIIKLFPVALAFIALASCSNDDLFNKDKSSEFSVKSASADIESFSVMTRSAITEIDGKASTRKLVWSDGDAYKQFGGSNKSDKYVLTDGAGTAQATFSFKGTLEELNNNGDETIALFPYTEESNLSIDGKTISMTLPSEVNWETQSVSEEGYKDGVVCNVPMFGIYNNEKLGVDFYYLTALLKIDLKNLPKRTEAVIIKTDKSMGGEFTSAIPEITQNDDTKYTYEGSLPEFTVGNVFKGGENYTYEVSFKAQKGWTNKTFFIPVPTGYYGVFNVYLRIDGTLQATPFIQIGDEYRDANGKEPIEWKRGKVRSLSKAFEINAGGTVNEVNSVLASAAFPETGDIEINVEPATNFKYGATSGLEFIIPDALKERNIIVNIPSGMTIAADGAATDLTIKAESAPLLASANKGSFTLVGDFLTGHAPTKLIVKAPETTVTVEGVDGGEKLKAIETLASTDGGFILGEKMELAAADDAYATVAATVNGGKFSVAKGGVISAGKIDAKKNATDIVVNGNVKRILYNGKTGVQVVGEADAHVTFTDTEAYTGSITVNNADPSGTLYSESDGAISVDGTAAVKISSKGNGDITVKNANAVTSISTTGTGAVAVETVETNCGDITAAKAASISIKTIKGNLGTVDYDGAGTFTVDGVKGTVTKLDASAASSFTVKGIEGTITDLNYAGTGAVEIAGVATKTAKFTNTATIKGGKVDISNWEGGNVTKSGTGDLTITNSDLGTVQNAGGTITATGGANGKSITTLTQNGAAKVTLTGMYDVTNLNIKADADVDYENTYIGTLTVDTGKKCTATGTKASGIGTGSGTLTPKTDIWDGSVCPTQTTGNVYTSASLAALCGTTTATSAKLFLDIDLGGTLNFQDKATTPNKGIKNVTTFDGNGKTIKNLLAETGLFANGGVTTVEKLTLDGAKITATQKAGVIMGVATASVTLNKVTVKNATLAEASTGLGTDAYIGGMIGEVNGASAEIKVNNGNVNNTTISGHYYLGGIIGGVTNAYKIYLYGESGKEKTDLVGTTTTKLTFNPKAIDGSWSTLKSGTIAPFIGGILKLNKEDGTKIDLQIYGTCDEVTKTLMETWKWSSNFLVADETIKFKGTKRNDLNFIGYTSTDCPDFVYALKLVSGFEANPTMTRRNTSATTTVLDTEYNCYMSYE